MREVIGGELQEGAEDGVGGYRWGGENGGILGIQLSGIYGEGRLEGYWESSCRVYMGRNNWRDGGSAAVGCICIGKMTV